MTTVRMQATRNAMRVERGANPMNGTSHTKYCGDNTFAVVSSVRRTAAFTDAKVDVVTRPSNACSRRIRRIANATPAPTATTPTTDWATRTVEEPAKKMLKALWSRATL